MRLRFAIPVFLGSALLFCLEPMLGRALLPHFGGTAAVWTMCLASYQLLLLAGAVYSDKLGRADGRSQYRVHLAMLALAALWAELFALFRPPLCALIPTGQGIFAQSAAAVVCVVAFAGLPFVIVGAGSSFIQHWAEESEGAGRETYRLYVVSNIGSFAGLLAYPIFVEPFVPQTWQWHGFACALALYALLCARAAPARRRRMQNDPGDAGILPADGRDEARPSPTDAARSTPLGGFAATPHSEGGCGAARGGASSPSEPPLQNQREADGPSALRQNPCATRQKSIIYYLLSVICYLRGKRAAVLAALLPALSSALLNATTTHIASDIEPLPLMWAVILGAFLLSYAIGFSRRGERLMPLWGALALASCVFAAWALGADGSQAGKFAFNLSAGLCVILFGGCFLHSWLCRVRPDGAGITRYYLLIAAGGAAGGLVSAIVPPLVFNSVAEYPVMVALLAVAVLGAAADAARRMRKTPKPPSGQTLGEYLSSVIRYPLSAVCIVWLLFAIFLRVSWLSHSKWVEDSGRSFYGTWKVGRDTLTLNRTGEKIPMKIFLHGGTMHGYEAVDPSRRTGATAYFGELGGGLAFSLNPKYAAGEPVDCAIIGMGIGVMAHYGREGDRILFYEIDGKVADAARRHFTFVPESKAEVPVVLGDARKALEAERDAGAAKHDILVVDAYSGDSIPYHLITRQAFRLYADRLAEGGTLALHVSNWHIDLLPVCKAAAKELGMEPLGVFSHGGPFTMEALWVLMSKDGFEAPDDPRVAIVDWDGIRDRPLPDDEVGSILPYVHFAK